MIEIQIRSECQIAEDFHLIHGEAACTGCRNTVMSALKYFDVPIVAIGLTNPKNSYECQIITRHTQSEVLYKKVVLKKGKIIGLILVGDIERAGIFFYLMKKGVIVDGFKEKLLYEDFGLVTLSEQLRRSMLAEALMP